MTLILSEISKYGLIQASDSNLTVDGQAGGQAQKTFRVPFLNSALSVAGSYTVGGAAMNQWMPSFIQSQEGVTLSLENFALALANRLRDQMSNEEKANGCMIQILGYSIDHAWSHPEMWFVRNILLRHQYS